MPALVARYEKNPILCKDDVPFPVETVHNAGVVKHNGRYTMLFRSHRRNGRSLIGLAVSDDGYQFRVRPRPFLVPADEGVFAEYEEYGVEDCRISAIEGTYLLTYSAYSRHGVRIGALGLPSGSSSQLTLSDTEEMIVGADITDADFSYADLSGADFNHENDLLDVIGWLAATWNGAWFHYLAEPDWPTGMVHTDHGITVRTPEPAALLLALLGLALLPRRRR